MDGNDRRAIEDLFMKLDGVQRSSPPRDPESEALIQSAIKRFPAAPYYMAQTIIVQQQALEEAQHRLGEAEDTRNDGFLGGLFGGRNRQPQRQVSRLDERPQAGPWGGGGFLAGAAQTAMGVAGGILLGNLIAGAFSGGSEAQAADSRTDDRAADDNRDDDRNDDDRDSSDNDSDYGDSGTDFADAGGDFGGDF